MSLYLSGLKDICHVCSHCSRASRSFWRSLHPSLVLIGLYKILSSVKSLAVELAVDRGRSLINSKKRRGLRAVPWGKPEETGTVR